MNTIQEELVATLEEANRNLTVIGKEFKEYREATEERHEKLKNTINDAFDLVTLLLEKEDIQNRDPDLCAELEIVIERLKTDPIRVIESAIREDDLGTVWLVLKLDQQKEAPVHEQTQADLNKEVFAQEQRGEVFAQTQNKDIISVDLLKSAAKRAGNIQKESKKTDENGGNVTMEEDNKEKSRSSSLLHVEAPAHEQTKADLNKEVFAQEQRGEVIAQTQNKDVISADPLKSVGKGADYIQKESKKTDENGGNVTMEEDNKENSSHVPLMSSYQQ